MGGRARTIGGGARTGDKPVGKGKREGYGGREGVNTEVELNRRRWKSIGRSTSNNSHATSIVATCSVARSYKISLRGWAEEEKESGRKGVKMEKRGNGERGDRDGKGKKIMKLGVSLCSCIAGSRAKSFAILREPCLLIECDIFELKEVYVRFDLSLRDCFFPLCAIRNFSYLAGGVREEERGRDTSYR